MEKKNTLLLTVIAIATLLVAVVGATFAYFSTTQSIDATIPVNVTTSTGAAAFTSETDQNLTFTVDSTEMQQALANNTTAEGLQDTASMNVSLMAAAADEVTTCTYSIEYVWTSAQQAYVDSVNPDTATYPTNNGCAEGYTLTEGKCTKTLGNFYYYKTPGLVDESEGNPAKEFTIELTGAFHDESGVKTTCDEGAEGCTLPITLGSYPETNIDGSNQKITLVDNQKISSSSVETATKVTWTATMKWYNRTENQDIQKSKVFEGKIAIGSVTC